MPVDIPDRPILLAVVALLLILAIPIAVWSIGGLGAAEELSEVEIASDGETVATLSVERAETIEEKQIGLSNHNSLSEGNGMLFIHSDHAERTYGMPDMDFAIDIAFIDDDCTITAIYSAEQPTEGESGLEPHHRYTDHAKYVLETSEGYLTDRASVGDEISFNPDC